MPAEAKLILDSISSAGARLLTFELKYALIVHNELLTHRTIGRSDDGTFELWLEASRNSSSNRAIPSSVLIQQVLDDPYIPQEFLANTRGMIAGDALDPETQEAARRAWLRASYEAVDRVYDLEKYNVAKQWRNRLLGPFQWITTVATANDQWWEHFFALRDHPAAQPDIAKIAGMAHELYKDSHPQTLFTGIWHLPYITFEDWCISNMSIENAIKVSVSRCARASYLRQGEVVSVSKDIELYERLTTSEPPHASPAEHVARAHEDKWHRSGNIYGFDQHRKILEDAA